MKRMIALLLVLIFVLASCAEEGDPKKIAPLSVKTHLADWSAGHANMTLTIPADWDHRVIEKEDRAGLSLILPDEEAEECEITFLPDGIGLCGTVSRLDELAFANGHEATGYFDDFGDTVSYTVPINTTPGTYMFRFRGDKGIYEKYYDTFLSILDSAVFGKGYLTRPEAKAIAEELRTTKYGNLRLDFDEERAVWLCRVYTADPEPLETFEIPAAKTEHPDKTE